MAKKKLSDTEKLALRFVQEFLGREFNYVTDRRYLGEAKRFVNPTRRCPVTNQKQRKYTIEQVLGCLRYMKTSLRKPLNSINCVTWVTKSGRSYLEEYCEPEPPPPIYMKLERKQWEERCGKSLQS